jgi:hypothetical protein
MDSRGQQPTSLFFRNFAFFSRPLEGASGDGTNSEGLAPGPPRHATSSHRQPGHLRPHPSTHSTTNVKYVYRQYDALIWQPDTHSRTNQDLPCDNRNCTSLLNFCRNETGVRCHADDITVDMTGDSIQLFVRKAKGNKRI